MRIRRAAAHCQTQRASVQPEEQRRPPPTTFAELPRNLRGNFRGTFAELAARQVHKRFDPIYVDARDRIRKMGGFGYMYGQRVRVRACVRARARPRVCARVCVCVCVA